MTAMDTKTTKPPAFPGFKKLSPTTYLYEPPTTSSNGFAPNGSLTNGHATHGAPTTPPPDTIIVFGWADASPRHVAKYTDIYQKLYPTARIIANLSSTAAILMSSAQTTRAAMAPGISALLSSAPPDGRTPPGRVLLHIFSNGGAMNFVGFSEAYQAQTHHFLPHVLLVTDSTPGGDELSTELMGWSRATANGLSTVPPLNYLPRAFVLGLAVVWVVLSVGISQMFGGMNVATRCRRSMNDPKLVGTSKDSERIYLYGDGDDIIGPHGVESHAQESEALGWRVRLVKFEGSSHVAHMRTHPEKYWGAVGEAWEEAVGRGK